MRLEKTGWPRSFLVCWGWSLGRLERGGRDEDKEDRSLAVR